MLEKSEIDYKLLKLMVAEFQEKLSRELTFEELKILQFLATKEEREKAFR